MSGAAAAHSQAARVVPPAAPALGAKWPRSASTNARDSALAHKLERLRDLEMVRLTTEESRNGHHLHLSIEQLFRLVRHGFAMRPLDSRLFREDATLLLNQVKLRNHVLQRVLRLMSLSRGGRASCRRTSPVEVERWTRQRALR